jgi:hypothetical protein
MSLVINHTKLSMNEPALLRFHQLVETEAHEIGKPLATNLKGFQTMKVHYDYNVFLDSQVGSQGGCYDVVVLSPE